MPGLPVEDLHVLGSEETFHMFSRDFYVVAFGFIEPSAP